MLIFAKRTKKAKQKKVQAMTNAINLQGFYTTFTQSATKQNASQSADFQNSLSDYQANMEKLWHNNATDETDLNMQIYFKSQSILGEVSQSRYERTLKSLLAKVQNFMQGIQKDSFAYDFVDDIYGNVIFWAEPEKVFIKNNRTNLHEKANILTLVQESKDKFLSALHNQSPSINQDFEEFKERLLNYKSCLEMVRTSFLPFFAAFKSEFSESEMQEIIDELATIGAYNDYKAHNISLADGSTISWSYDKNGNMLVKINEFDINTALENADKALTEMENFKTLLEMFKQRENLNGLESGLNSEKLHSNSHSNLTNSSENLGKNSNLQASYTINTPRKQVGFREGVSYEFEYPQNANTPFSNAVSAAQPVVSESEYNQALSRIKDLMDEIVAFVISEQGTDSELGFNLDQMDKHFIAQMESNSVKLDMLKSQIKNYNGDDKLIINTMQSYFAFGGQTATHYIAKFFDYASDKIENLPVAQIVQDLSIVKGYWDNNTEQGFVIEGKKLSLSQIFNEKTKRYQTKLNIDDTEFSDINFNSTSDKFESKKFEILLGIFEKREKISVQNSNANLSKTNSNDSFLKELLKSI